MDDEKTCINTKCEFYDLTLDDHCGGECGGEPAIVSCKKFRHVSPKIVVLCGSSKFCEVMAVCAWLIERDEKTIAMGLHLLPSWYCEEKIPDHLAEHEGVAAAMDELHLRKIDLADEVFVVNKNDYIGESTEREVRYAMSKGTKIRWYSHDLVGKRTQELLDEAIDRHLKKAKA